MEKDPPSSEDDRKGETTRSPRRRHFIPFILDQTVPTTF